MNKLTNKLPLSARFSFVLGSSLLTGCDEFFAGVARRPWRLRRSAGSAGENNNDFGCDQPSLWADDLFGNADDFVGQSEPVTLQDGVVVSFDTTTAAIGFGRGL